MYEFCNNSATCNSCRGRDLFHSLNKILPFIKISTLMSCLPLLLLGGHLVSFSFFLLTFPRKRPIIFIASLYLAVSIGHPKSEFRTTPPDYKCGGHGGNTIDDGCR
jgi:hypothetical protein